MEFILEIWFDKTEIVNTIRFYIKLFVFLKSSLNWITSFHPAFISEKIQTQITDQLNPRWIPENVLKNWLQAVCSHFYSHLGEHPFHPYEGLDGEYKPNVHICFLSVASFLVFFIFCWMLEGLLSPSVILS